MNKKNNKILWVSPANLLDTTSGFALSVREMLFQLSKNNFDIKILSATTFDNSNGMTYFQDNIDYLNSNIGKIINISDENLIHETYVTKSIKRDEMQAQELYSFFEYYCKAIKEFTPDIVFFYKDGILEQSIAREAKYYGIKTVVYLVNPNYTGTRWIRDVDLIITDSDATVKMYKERESYNLKSVGTFLNPKKYISNNKNNNTQKNILFVNPSFEKGVIFVIQLALYLEKIGSNIMIEVVNSRSNWNEILKLVTKSLGKQREYLPNVIETKNTNNMKQISERTKILLVPSFWFDSGPRVIAEAQLNGIPVIGSNFGGVPELIGKGGFIINFSKNFNKPPYNNIVDEKQLQSIVNIIYKIYNDREFYTEIQKKVYENVKEKHDIMKNTKKLINTLTTF